MSTISSPSPPRLLLCEDLEDLWPCFHLCAFICQHGMPTPYSILFFIFTYYSGCSPYVTLSENTLLPNQPTSAKYVHTYQGLWLK